MLLITQGVYMAHTAEILLFKYALMSEYISEMGIPALSHAMLHFTVGDKYAEAVLFAYCSIIKREYNISY